jgi:hypothetical protein
VLFTVSSVGSDGRLRRRTEAAADLCCPAAAERRAATARVLGTRPGVVAAAYKGPSAPVGVRATPRRQRGRNTAAAGTLAGVQPGHAARLGMTRGAHRSATVEEGGGAGHAGPKVELGCGSRGGVTAAWRKRQGSTGGLPPMGLAQKNRLFSELNFQCENISKKS